MRILPFRTTACLIRGDDLVTVSVSGSALGGRARPGPVIEGALTRPIDEVRAALRDLPPGRITLIVPSTWCSVRPIALTTAKWGSARDEVRRSVEGLLPIAADDALVGLMNRAIDPAVDSEAAAGYLIGTARSRVQPWCDCIEQATGRRVETIMSTHMALLGLGLQHEPLATVVEETGRGRVCHRLRHGRVEALEARWDPNASSGEVIELPSATPGSDGRAISAADLAVAGALASQVGAGDLQPLAGKSRSLGLPWLVPVAAILLAGVVTWASFQVMAWRYQAGTARIQAERAALVADLEAVQAAREETGRLIRAIDKGVNEATADWKPILPVLHAAQVSVPKDGFLYRLEVRPNSVMVSGEAPRYGDVLQALEEDDRFADAHLLYAISVVPERGTEKFDIEARRVDTGKVGVR